MDAHSERIVRATLAPVIPDPMMTISAVSGSVCDCASTRSGNGGFCNQKDVVGFGTGIPGLALMRFQNAVKFALSSAVFFSKALKPK